MGVNRTGIDQYQLRLPVGLRDQIKSSAEAEGRTMNAEIVLILQRHYAHKQAFSTADAAYTDLGKLLDPPQ